MVFYVLQGRFAQVLKKVYRLGILVYEYLAYIFGWCENSGELLTQGIEVQILQKNKKP